MKGRLIDHLPSGAVIVSTTMRHSVVEIIYQYKGEFCRTFFNKSLRGRSLAPISSRPKTKNKKAASEYDEKDQKVHLFKIPSGSLVEFTAKTDGIYIIDRDGEKSVAKLKSLEKIRLNVKPGRPLRISKIIK